MVFSANICRMPDTSEVACAHSLFLVPPPEYNDAATHAGKNLKVIKVATLQEALAALAANGGDVPDKLAAQSISN